jgi:hypothetical protein
MNRDDMTPTRTCDKRQRPLIEIDHHPERLIDCIECNRWGWAGSALFMELPEDDLQAWSCRRTISKP